MNEKEMMSKQYDLGVRDGFMIALEGLLNERRENREDNFEWLVAYFRKRIYEINEKWGIEE